MFSNSKGYIPGDGPGRRQRRARPSRRRADSRFVRPRVVPPEDWLLPSVFLVT
jgi:hypothetical protein